MACATASRPSLELQHIFREQGRAYRAAHRLPEQHRKAMWAIEHCRTAALGGHVDHCGGCGLLRLSYNSCGNRHCPKCQAAAQRRWVEERQRELLPVEYFHVVFTLPQALVPLVRGNQRLLYGLLFRSSAETLLAFGRRHFKGELGITSVLHTWGQTLAAHPHVHCVVTGGALAAGRSRGREGPAWRWAPKGFLFPVRALSQVFRGKFIDGLREAYERGALRLEGPVATLQKRAAFEHLVRRLYRRAWVVYAKRPFADAAAVVGYLGRYTHRTALSNRRLVHYDGTHVGVTWKDYCDEGRRKVMTLAVEEFIRRFLLHVLPAGFKRIRHYGLLACRGRGERLALCRRLLTEATVQAAGGAPAGAPAGDDDQDDEIAQAQAADELTPPWRQYPSCGKELRIRLWVWPKGCGPPSGWQQQRSYAWQWKAA